MKAPAKLNLHLQVGDRKRSGFHDIHSLFVMVDIYDEINLSSLKTSNDCKISGSFNCETKDNLIYKAWKAFCDETDTQPGVDFQVSKKIPVFAGMGGGSSDAAAALMGLNQLMGEPLSDKDLRRIGCSLGSDVPFFLGTPAVIAGGRGEVIHRNLTPRVLDFLVIYPEIKISTAEAYRWVDESASVRNAFADCDELSDIYEGELTGFNAYTNDFAEVLCGRFSEFNTVLKELNDCGAVFSNITGSGSAVFGLFENTKAAEEAEKKLKNSYKFVQKIKSLDRIPIAILE